MSGPIYDQYTLSSVLTGAEVFTWMYHKTKKDKYWEIASMRSDENIPYILAEEGSDWAKRGDPNTDYNLWTKMTYGTSAYVGRA